MSRETLDQGLGLLRMGTTESSMDLDEQIKAGLC